MEAKGVCCKGVIHLSREEWKVFVVNEFHFCYKETMEGVCRKSLTHLLQREWKWKAFVIRGFHVCYKEWGYRRYL